MENIKNTLIDLNNIVKSIKTLSLDKKSVYQIIDTAIADMLSGEYNPLQIAVKLKILDLIVEATNM